MTSSKIVLSLMSGVVAVSAALFGDGGYQTEPVPCMEQWTYKEKTDGGNIETEITGCTSFDDFKPFPYFETDTSDEISTLLEPSDSRTNKGKWCAVLREVYNPTPQRTESNKFNWGYCLDDAVVIATDPPTSPEPQSTPAPTETKETPFPSKSPTDPEPTPAPTEEVTLTIPPVESSPPVPSPTNPPFEEVPSNTEESSFFSEEWTAMGLAVAGALVLVAIVMGVLLALKLKAKKDEVVDENEEERDLEDTAYMAKS